ncbi:MAG: Rrf2 family transcriptional regulator [Acidobacteria bacterium]|nr:Rrf2 family transcriptional regulator [Acidobacteriota bacterium]
MFSKTTEYALGALVHLARSGDAGALRGRRLAELCGVPHAYLMKILSDLARVRIVHGARGSGGGYQLARPAATVRLVEIVELFEGPLERDHCLLGPGQACAVQPCPAHDCWMRVREPFIEFVKTRTLADLAGAAPGGSDE